MTERRKSSDGPKGPEKNRSPQAESDRGDLRGDEVVGSDFGFGNPAWALRVLLGTSQGESRQFCVEAGPMTLTLTALDPEYGLPYGTYARLVFAWICTEVVRTRSPVLHLGRRFSEFMTRHGVPTSHSGGALRVPTRLRDQMNRLFSCGIMRTYTTPGHETHTALLITTEDDRWLDPHDREGRTFREWKIEIGHKLFVEILTRAGLVVPGR